MGPLAKILTSNNAQVFRQLGSRAFRGAPIEHEVAPSAAALLERARRSKPAVVILDGLLPDGSGFDVCKEIKNDPELAGVRVMMLLDNPATQEQLSLAENSGCDDILCLPAPPGELFGHLASVLGFHEADTRRVQEKLIADIDLGKSKVRGEVLDLAESGARVRLAERVIAPPKVHVRMTRAITGATHELDAGVIWQRQQPAGEWEAGLKFAPVDPQVLGSLRASCLWDKAPTDEGVMVSFRGDFVESVDFNLLLAELAPERAIEFELSRVRRLNSVGACRWSEMVHSLSGRKLSFLRCSLEFTSHAAMTTGMLGGGRVESLAAPYACERCAATEVRLLQVAALWDGDRLRPPILRCSACGGELVFDDIPERYFSFLV